MFLATTANQKYWDKNQKILFLGEWCRLYSQKHIWSNINHEVLPSHWDETEKLEEHFLYLQSIQEKYLGILAVKLNEIHRENHPLSYWRIILGPWLIVFIGIIYDRYLSISRAIESNLVSHTWLPPIRPREWTAACYDDLVAWARNDNFNLYLYGRIIDRLNKIPYQIKENTENLNLEPRNTYGFFREKVKKKIKHLVITGSKLSGLQYGERINFYLSIGLLDRIKLAFSLARPVNLVNLTLTCGKFDFSEKTRIKLKMSQGINEFERLLEEMIVEQMPTSYVEGFKDTREKVISAFPKKTKIVVANNCWGNDSYQIWIANQIEKGSKLIICQHGGGYGYNAFIPSEVHDRKICDKYFTWGWTEGDDPKLQALGSPQLTKLKKSIKPDPNGAILLVSNSAPRYFIDLGVLLNNARISISLDEQARFLKAASNEVLKILLVRLFPINYGWDEKNRLTQCYPDITVYQGRQSLKKQLQRSRLAIHVFNTTSFLETMSMNFPSILYFDQLRSPLRNHAKSYFEDLSRVKIFHNSPESAAKWINKNYMDPVSWWLSDEVQEVRENFCKRFARINVCWASEWKETLLKINGL